PEPFGKLPAGTVVRGPRLRGDGEARRHRDSKVRHLRQLAALATEQIAHQRRAFCTAATEGVDVLRHGAPVSIRGVTKKSFNPTGCVAVLSISLTLAPPAAENKRATGRLPVALDRFCVDHHGLASCPWHPSRC